MTMIMSAGFYPFWFWNDRLETNEIEFQITQMAGAGIRGFYVCPRQGLGQPYMSEVYFQMLDVAIAAAEKLGLQVHLYDEYPYPSGVAGGEVTLGNPEFYATYLDHQIFDVEGPDIRIVLRDAKVLSVKAFPFREGSVDWTSGIDLRRFVGVLQVSNSYMETGLTRYNHKRYFTSRPIPILEATLPKGSFRIYASQQGEWSRHKYYGHFVDAMNPEAIREFIKLTHERYRERYGAKFGKTIGSIFADEIAPQWSSQIPNQFNKQYGYDLLEKMPALVDASHPDHTRVASDLNRLQYRLFCEAFDVPISQWCRQYGLLYVAEKPALRLSQLQYADIPGCEPGHTRAGDPMDLLQTSIRGNARAAVSAAYFYDKPGALCECYHSMGWGATLQDAKLIADGLLLMGIQFLVPHAFFYSTHGLRKHDAPPSWFFQMPYWPMWRYLSQRIDRITTLFQGTHIDAQVLVIEPTPGLPTPEQTKRYEKLLQRLMAKHVEFLFVDTDILTEALIIDGCVQAKEVLARVVIVPPMTFVESALQEWLQRFSDSGGRVVWLEAGDDFDVAPSLNVAPELQVVSRCGADRRLWFILNPTGKSINMELPAEPALHEVSLDDNDQPMLKEQDNYYHRTIQPFESVMLMADPGSNRVLPVVTAVIHELMEVYPKNANLLRMYEWEMMLGEQRAKVPAVPLAHQLDKGGFCFAPKVNHFFGSEPELAWPEMNVRYESSFQCEYDGDLQLVMEPGSIVGEWKIYINDSGPLTDSDFTPAAAHVRGSVSADITRWVRSGANTIRVELIASRADDGLLNALYLAGGFGVKLSGPTLMQRVHQGSFEQYNRNGLPHYAGIIEYRGNMLLPELPNDVEIIVNFGWPSSFQEACEVSINGGPFKPVLWQPRCIKVSLREIQSGCNRITIRVFTSLYRVFEGEEVES